MRRGLTIVMALFAGTWASAQTTPERSLESLLATVAETLERYYAKAQSVMCVETVTQQGLNGMSPDASFPRRLVYNLRVAWDAAEDGSAPHPRLERELVSANGRPPRPNDTPRCTDPETSLDNADADRLEFLLAPKQAEYIFSVAGHGKVSGRNAVMLDYRSRARGKATAEQIDKGNKYEECFRIDMPGYDAGRVWLDAETSDVLRLDQRTTGPVDFRVRARPSLSFIDFTVQRNDISTVYRPVTFRDPDETLMMPVSSETFFVVRGLAGRRESRRFTNYQRFSTGGRLVPLN